MVEEIEQLHKINYENHEGIHVLRVSGTDYEMGFQHGVALKEFIKKGTLPYFSNYVDQLLKNAVGDFAGSLLNKALVNTVGKKIAKNFPPYVLDSFNGLIDGAELSKKEVMNAIVMPETFLWVMSKLLELKNPMLAPRFLVPTMGCSTVIATKKATSKGMLLHGRNFDYQGVGAWDTETAVVFHKPIDSQAYVAVSSAGVLLGGATSMNESGLTFAVHQHLSCSAFSLGKGLPTGVIGDLIMRYATNLEEAKKILESHKPIGCWTYIITSAKEDRILCYEAAPEERAYFITNDETFGYTNMFLDRSLAEQEYFMYPSQWRSNASRFHCIKDRLEKNKGNIDENTIASILGERNNETCRLSEPVAMLLTVASAVFRPEDGVFFVGAGKAPTSNRSFIPFSLKKQTYLTDIETLSGGIPKNEEDRSAFEAYRESYEAYFNRNDIDYARMKMNKSIKLQPKETLYYYLSALLAIVDKDFENSLKDLNKAIDIGHKTPERICSLHLWRARVYDILGERDTAIKDYRMALKGDYSIQIAAENGIKEKWKWKKFHIEFNYADVVNP